MTAKPEQRTQQAHAEPPEAVAYGIDLSMLRANLALTPTERLRRHPLALDRMRRLQKARFP